MKVDYKSLNRQTSFTLEQKAAIRKIFKAAELAAIKNDASLVNEKTVHLAMSGWFTGDQKHDMQVLFREVRTAMNTTKPVDNNISNIVGSFRMNGRQRRIIRTMADSIMLQVS